MSAPVDPTVMLLHSFFLTTMAGQYEEVMQRAEKEGRSHRLVLHHLYEREAVEHGLKRTVRLLAVRCKEHIYPGASASRRGLSHVKETRFDTVDAVPLCKENLPRLSAPTKQQAKHTKTAEKCDTGLWDNIKTHIVKKHLLRCNIRNPDSETIANGRA